MIKILEIINHNNHDYSQGLEFVLSETDFDYILENFNVDYKNNAGIIWYDAWGYFRTSDFIGNTSIFIYNYE